MSQRAEAVFISDLHLCAEQPAITQAFFDFLGRAVAGKTDRLFILGDLFEYWVGDDDLGDVLNQRIAQALRQLAESGIALFFIAGNRDFLIGSRFAEAAGVTLLPDPHLAHFKNCDILLSHGDALCIDDADYQAFRAMVREPAWQAAFLAQPLALRHAQITDMRQQSERAKMHKPATIMDVNQTAVAGLFRSTGQTLFIHGHTHRPAHHRLTVDAIARERWVLTDWDAQAKPPRGGGLVLDQDGLHTVTL
jgi:UDP-2,3-diacylglucosamine hydrolase